MVETGEKELPPRKQATLPLREKREQFAALLLQWFEKNKRDFPWRSARDPYRAAIAEILLQKTSVVNAKPIYEQFICAYPTVYDLAAAEPTELARLLRPLGIPRRAILVQQLAIEIILNYEGHFPETEEELRTLPGLGPYGAGAVASQVFNRRAPMIDINVMRIFERFFSIKSTPRAGPSKGLRKDVLETTPIGDEARFNLALLDFGALVCRKRDPQCSTCPLAHLCDYNIAQSLKVPLT